MVHNLFGMSNKSVYLNIIWEKKNGTDQFNHSFLLSEWLCIYRFKLFSISFFVYSAQTGSCLNWLEVRRTSDLETDAGRGQSEKSEERNGENIGT